MDPNDTTLMTVTDAAQLAGVHPQTMRRWIDEGRIPSVSVYPTNRVRVRRDDVDAAASPKARNK